MKGDKVVELIHVGTDLPLLCKAWSWYWHLEKDRIFDREPI